MTKLTKTERQRCADTIEALRKDLMTKKEISEVIESNHEGEKNWKNWLERKRHLKKVLEHLVDEGDAVKSGKQYRLPKPHEERIFNLEKLRAIVQERENNGESLAIHGGLGAGDFSSKNNRSAAFAAAMQRGGKMDDTLVLLAARNQYPNMGISQPMMHNVDPKTLKRLANHSDFSVASLILKPRLFTVKGINEATFQQIYLDWTNAKIDKAEARRLQSLPHDIKMFKLAKAIDNAR